MPVLVQYENDFDDQYFAATRNLTPDGMDSFAQYFVGALGPYLSPEAVTYCLAVAKTLQEQDEAQARFNALSTAIVAEASRIQEKQESASLYLVKR